MGVILSKEDEPPIIAQPRDDCACGRSVECGVRHCPTRRRGVWESAARRRVAGLGHPRPLSPPMSATRTLALWQSGGTYALCAFPVFENINMPFYVLVEFNSVLGVPFISFY